LSSAEDGADTCRPKPESTIGGFVDGVGFSASECLRVSFELGREPPSLHVVADSLSLFDPRRELLRGGSGISSA